MKQLLFTRRNDALHWVGDGFPVRTIFSYNNIAKETSPFLLMDYAGPANFPPSNSQHRRGVGKHPHRGFETVTIVYDGQVEHRDSSGGGGVIGPGEVQWMTAASGLIHEEYHGGEFSKTGGPFEMIQLWVNLPAKDKMVKPRYQSIQSKDIPIINLENGEGLIRVIAGNLKGKKGPAKTFTPINLWDLRLNGGHTIELRTPKGHTTLAFILSGRVRLATGEIITDAELAILSREEEVFTFNTLDDAKILLLSGEPINEPIVGHGPFVMNSTEEIRQAFADFESGKMGSIEPIEGSEI